VDTNQRHAQAQHEVRQASREDAPTGWSKKARLPEEWAEGEGEMIPIWLVQLGSLAGLLAFCVTIWDRMLSSRPLVWISPGDYGRQVHCKNIATCDITIRTIRCHPSSIGVASSTSLNAVVRASAGQGFMAILKADQEREFPLIFKR
jgi:hypothetical protein